MKEAGSIGARGEERAADYLRRKGCRIIERNYRCRLGEIDIIASDGEYLLFVEVKQRKSSLYGEAKEFVTQSKQKKLRAAASIWLSFNETGLQPRFDVIEIYEPEGIFSRVTINHIEDAF